MKITHNKVGQNLNLRDSGKTEKSDGAKGATGTTSTGSSAIGELAGLEASKVDISGRAQDIRKAKDIANATPDIDEAKVARLQKLIDDGNYKIDAGAIADKMISEQGSWE